MHFTDGNGKFCSQQFQLVSRKRKGKNIPYKRTQQYQQDRRFNPFLVYAELFMAGLIFAKYSKGTKDSIFTAVL